MRTLKIALLATVATAALSSATIAADLIIADPVINNTYGGFDWEGPYAGLFVMGHDFGLFGIGVDAGVNVLVNDGFLLGLEGDVAWLSDNSWIGQVNGRAGVLVTDGVLLYGLAGVGFDSKWDAYVPLGVGAEFAVADNLTLRAQYQFQWDFDNVAENAHVGKVGFNWHF
ncbi:MAG: outer membrane beta-barrel protein [Devosia sp.]|nr:outer membrane beta-barrel protein [Devosia sp.]